jgi:predicted ribosome quality control (RQC) complex YloA/Tae2 family protein
MHINSKISYIELEQLIYVLKNKLNKSYLKKIYHYDGLWLFKFNHHSFIYDPGNSIWVGSFFEREDGKNLHSICKKLRKEISDKKLIDINIFDNDRTVVLEFKNYKLVFELYAQGNMILIDNNNKIIKVHREIKKKGNDNNNYIREHGMIYHFKEYKNYDNYKLMNYGWKINNIEVTNDYNDFNDIYEALSNLWLIKYNKKILKKEKIKSKKNKFSVKDNINKQVDNFNKKILKKNKKISDIENRSFNEINYNELNKLYSEKKKIKSKLIKAEDVLKNKNFKEKNNKKLNKPKINLIINKWYQNYYWWYTKNGFLVVGGRDITDNEKLVKTYLGENDYYFHTDEAKSGSFIMFTGINNDYNKNKSNNPGPIDLDETAEGVLALSTQWNSSYSSGNVFYVLGKQVSKTPPTGQYLTKGSFMIYGTKNEIKVSSCVLGYGLYNNQLMLAPYRIINRLEGGKVKITQKQGTAKMRGVGKMISNAIKKELNVILNDKIKLFNRPCKVYYNK